MRRNRSALSCFRYLNRRQNRCTVPTPALTTLRDEEGVELKPSPVVAIALDYSAGAMVGERLARSRVDSPTTHIDPVRLNNE
ncbi:hypothetical protein PPGU19_099140 (plasmid) [Paraburkholderia sp. PGU19]|nr:hypothetical protein PPGU19_099140 [Paraburkholderia sp. PGU19]